VPLGGVDAAALLAIGWLALAGARLRGAGIAALLVSVFALAAYGIPGSGGLRARYFANAAASGEHEPGVEYPRSAFTRIDRQLTFGGDAREVPLPFFNDPGRFNFFRSYEPNRRQLAFAVRWSGAWWCDGGTQAIYVHAPRAEGDVSIDGNLVVRIGPTEPSPVAREIEVTRGWHRLDVSYASPYQSPREFQAGIVVNGVPVPFDEANVATQPSPDWQHTAARVLAWAKIAVDAIALVYLGWMCATTIVSLTRRARNAATIRDRRIAIAMLFAAAAAIEAMVFAWRWLSRNMVLVGGDDTLTYEWYARDILLNGPLMNFGLPLGQGEPFYYQPFYPYFLAGAHALFGESMFGPVLVQRLLAAFTMWMVVDIAILVSAEAVWLYAWPVAIGFIGWKFWHIAAIPLNESFYVPMMTAAIWSLLRLVREPSTRRAVATGIVGGVAAVTRSTLLLTFALVWPACWLALRGRPKRAMVLAALAATTLAIFSLIAVRNAIVAHRFAPASTELGVTLLGGNEIPEGVTIDMTQRGALYRRLGVSDLTAQVIEYAITAPGRFALHQGRKALFALGFYEPYAPGWGYSPVYIAVWVTALGGLAVALRLGTLPPAAVSIPALIAIVQFMAVVIIYPKGERLIVPIHTALLPYVPIALWAATNRRALSRTSE
jgi:hypothetical protein